MIIMCMRFFAALGIPAEQMTLLINSMGDESCRPAYTQAVRDYEAEHADELCDECKRRIDVNPLRSFDCKNEACKRVMDDAPRFSDYLCDSCSDRFEQVKSCLNAPRYLVRGRSPSRPWLRLLHGHRLRGAGHGWSGNADCHRWRWSL